MARRPAYPDLPVLRAGVDDRKRLDKLLVEGCIAKAGLDDWWSMDRMMGDASATSLEEVYREHRVALLRLAYLVGASRELAEDVVQAAFASAQPRWDQVDDAVAYLKRAVVNQVKDDQRRWYRRRDHRATQPTGPLYTLPPEVDETWGVIAALPWPQRAVIVLHYYEDLPLNEIADILDRPAATVRSDHRRALERLRKALR